MKGLDASEGGEKGEKKEKGHAEASPVMLEKPVEKKH
jgi:hypothetical protein